MKRLISTALLAGVFFTSPLYGEEATIDALLPFDLPAPTTPVAPVAAAIAPPTLTPALVSSLKVAQMGQPAGIAMGGGQSQGGITFTLPIDQVITNARLILNLNVSPAMAEQNTTLQLMLNGQPLGSVPLGAADSDTSRFQLDVPAALLVSVNNLSFKITGDANTFQCRRDTDGEYRVTILPDSHFELEGQQLNIGNELINFPRPFFDAMQMSASTVSFSFTEKVSADAISAAALLSSWLGIEADYRGVNFDTKYNVLPEKNGILIGHPGETIGGVTLPESDEPLLQYIDNPVNPVYKLLLVVGKDETALRMAAWRLTQNKFEPQTASLKVEMKAIPVSQPYDAPRWIPTDRPVKLSELLRTDQTLTTTGIWHEPLNIAFRAAPDLFLWDGGNIPMHINYRFPAEDWIDESHSWLSVTLNSTFLRNLPVNKQGALETLWRKMGGDARQEQADIAIEPYQIYGDNQLSLYFHITPQEDASCAVLLNNNIKSRIDDTSTIDLSHTRHFALLPNLSFFVGASFPFTRLADFSQTVLLLSENPTETQVSTLLEMVARSGNATGTALANNRVLLGIPAGGSGLEMLRNRDVLAVSNMTQALFNQGLLKQSPFSTRDSSLVANKPTLWQKTLRWLGGDWTADNIEADRYFSSNADWRGFISFPSQWNSDRLVVVILGSNDDQLSRLPVDLNSAKINAGIRGDAAIITDENGVRSFRVGGQYPSGEMPRHMMIVWYANQHAVLLAISGLVFSIIFGLFMYGGLKRRARKRLNPENNK